MALESYQERVVAEKAELDERLGKLRAFIASDAFPALPEYQDMALLRQQAAAMQRYSDILARRIGRFE